MRALLCMAMCLSLAACSHDVLREHVVIVPDEPLPVPADDGGLFAPAPTPLALSASRSEQTIPDASISQSAATNENSIVARPAQPSAPAEPSEPVEVFPGVILDRALSEVRFDGTVSIDTSDIKARVFLEVLICARDSREHESLIVTNVKPSHVHAALLALGLVPGSPCGWEVSGSAYKGVKPTGAKVDVLARWQSHGRMNEANVAEWAVTTMDAGLLANRVGEALVFAGSSMRMFTPKDEPPREVYHADMEGTIVGLTCFGHETIAWTGMYSPDATRETPHWIARVGAVPKAGTPITIIIRSSPE